MAASENQKRRAEAVRAKHRFATNAGAQMIAEAGAEPPADAGVFAKGFEKWEPGKTYTLNQPFVYNGCVGFCRQASLVAIEVYPPFSTGTESLYGVRPAPDDSGVFPYMYNMAVKVGMKVRENETVYECIQAANPLLYPPSAVPAHFKVADGEE